jgi:hypothetical protein
MNALLIAAMLVGTTYRAEDFHYYDTNLQPRGLQLINKVYVEVAQQDKRDFITLIDKHKNVERFKEFDNGELRGYVIFLNGNKRDTVDFLNSLSEKYRAFPVVLFDGIECTTRGEIAVQVRPSVNIDDYTKRLNAIADGKFNINQLKQKLYMVSVDELKNPSNILILSNLLAKDSAWVEYALIAWVPLDGYVKANMAVETGANSQLGEMRNLKLTVDVFDPDIKVRTDLFPQLGQGFQPFPFAGDVWFDPSPPKITETKTIKGKQVVAEFNFRQLQYGNFIFQPVVVSYERNGELKTVKTSSCQYSIRSVIQGTDVDDIQPRPTDKLDFMILQPVGFPKREDPNKVLYSYAKVGISTFCFGLAAIFIASALASFKQGAAKWFRADENDIPWKAMEACRGTGQPYYQAIAVYVNKVLNLYGASLYSVNLSECTSNFRNLVGELDKLYQPNPTWNHESLRDFVHKLYKDLRYK